VQSRLVIGLLGPRPSCIWLGVVEKASGNDP
jgi:hypothetical protein